MFIDTESGASNGTFSSPNYGHGNYPADLQCVYTFVAQPHYRVSIGFDDFRLSGTAVNCHDDYVDVYAELVSPGAQLLQHNVSGRYCGTVAPSSRVSLHQVIVMVLHSRKDSPGATGFKGTYEFVPEARFIPGTPIPSDRCGYVIDSSLGKTGDILSPTYPGTYPSNFRCWYLLRGSAGQRMRITFKDFDLYFGGEHCPYDALTIYDGATTVSPMVRRVCGMQPGMVFYSRGDTMLLEFNATDPPFAEHRGFQIGFEFSSQFVDLDRLIAGENGVYHVRGTECDVRVMSRDETEHWIRSPNASSHMFWKKKNYTSKEKNPSFCLLWLN